MIPIAYAATVVTKGTETVDESQKAVVDFLSFLWDRLDNWIAALILLIFSIYFAKTFRKIVVDKISNQVDDAHEDMIVLAGRATYAGILAVGVTIALKVAGIDITTIIAAVGFGIGFALQDLIMNFIAGILILLNHPFKLGDCIKVNDTVGKVVEIQSRLTILLAFDGTRVVVPNSDLINKQITSFTSNPFRRIEILVGVEYSTNLQKAMQVCMAVMQTHPNINKDPAPTVLLNEFGDSSINLKVRFWVDSKSNWLKTKTEIIHQLKTAFDQAKISIPFPIRTVYMNNNKQSEINDIQNSLPENKPIELTKEPQSINKEPITTVIPEVQEIEIHEITEPKIQKEEVKKEPLKNDFAIPPIDQNRDLSGADFLNNINK